MKIAITGAGGFIGQELLAVLRNRTDLEIVALSRSSMQAGDDSVEWRRTDYSTDSLTAVLQDVNIVIHLAGVRGTTQDPADYVINEELTEHLLQSMVNAGTKRIVFASTISVYDDESRLPWTEEMPANGRPGYGRSKVRCEKLIQDYSNKYGFTYAIARIAQVLGEGEKRRGMMNVFIDTAREHGTLKVIGKSIAKRQYIYVKDLAEILTILAVGGEHYKADDNIVVNVGMPNVYTNLEIAQIVNITFDNPTPIDYDDSEAETIWSSYMDVTRLHEVIEYHPKDMKDALRAMG